MTITLPPDLERVVSQAIASDGFASPDEVLREALTLLGRRDEAPAKPAERESAPALAKEEWKVRLRDWSARHPSCTHEVDVTRNSIYSGRG